MRYYKKRCHVEPFIVNIGGDNRLVLSEDDIGTILSIVFKTPKLTRTSFVSLLKEILSIDIEENYTGITTSQIDALSSTFPFMANYDLQRQRRIVHFYETDKAVKKFFDENLSEPEEQVEEFVSNGQIDEPGNEEIKAVWEKFSQLFGQSDEEQKNAINKRREYLNKDKFKNFIGRLSSYSVKYDLSKASSKIENGKSIGKMFEDFYKIDSGNEIEIKDDKIIKKDNSGNEAAMIEMNEGVKTVIENIMREAMQKNDSNKYDEYEEDSPYVLDNAGDILSNKLVTYLLNTEKTMTQLKTFIRVLVITGRSDNNPMPAFKMMLKRGIQESLKYDSRSQEAPEGFRGWK